MPTSLMPNQKFDHVVYELFGVTRDEIDLIERL